MGDKQLRYKELSAIVKGENLAWIVNQNYQPDDLIHLNAMGSVPPKGLKPASKTKSPDLKQFITAKTSNPFLYERRKGLGFITGKAAKVSRAQSHMMSHEIRTQLGAPGLSNSVDWRQRWGTRWVTLPKNQNPCGNCWAFSAVGVVESMVRIEHCAWSIRSEGDVRDGMHLHCADGSWPNTALSWISTNGVADPDCYPFYNYDHPYTPTADRSGRRVFTPAPVALPTANDQKTWLDTVGPITMCLEVWHDFDGYGGGVYVKSTNPANYYRGLHAVVIVGYDDTNSCWICKNSWGQGWGESWSGVKGYFRIKYGEVKCDDFTKYGVHYTNPDPWTKRRLHNGNLLESGDGGIHRNFELLFAAGGQAKHFWRDDATLAWHAGPAFANDVAACPSLINSTFNRNLECVYLTGGNRLHHWWRDQNTKIWHDGGVFGPADANGIPGFIQSNYNAPGNFEVVARTGDGRLNQWWRDSACWHDGGRFGNNIAFSGPALVQSNYGTRGNFELVAVCAATHQMQHFWRDNDHGNVWNPGVCFGSNVFSPPVMVQGQYGAVDEKRPGNFELCVAVGGSVQHWWRDNLGGTGWHMSASFGTGVLAVAGLLESSYGFNLECIVLLYTGHIQHWWRNGAGWHAGPVIA